MNVSLRDFSQETPRAETATHNRTVCADLSPTVRRKPFDKGAQISLTGLGHRAVVTVAQGAIRLESILGDGRRQILGFCFKDEQLYGACKSLDLRHIALTKGAISIRSSDRDRYGECHHDTAPWQNDVAQDCLENLATQLVLLGRCTASERIATFLIDMASRLGVARKNGFAVGLPMKRDDIADFLGLNAETVSRQFSRLKSAEIVALPKPGLVVIRNVDALLALSPFAERYAASRMFNKA